MYSLLLCRDWQDVGGKTQRVLTKPSEGSSSSVCVWLSRSSNALRGAQSMFAGLHPWCSPSTSLPPQALNCRGLERSVLWRGRQLHSCLLTSFLYFLVEAIGNSYYWKEAVKLKKLGSTKSNGFRSSDYSSPRICKKMGGFACTKAGIWNGNGKIQALCVWRGDWGCVMWVTARLEIV